jgi:hypothetical protein
VLKPGGRVALAAWDVAERNPWMSLGRRVAIERELVPPPEPGAPGPFSFAEPGRIQELLEGAGFDDIVVEAVDFTFDARSLDAWWEQTLRTSPSMEEMVSDLSPADHYAFRDAFDAAYAEFVAPDGSVSLPARTLVAVAGA